MNKIRIVKRFFSKSEARNAAAAQRELAKKEGIKKAKVEIISARELFRSNGWNVNPPAGLSRPTDDQYMVVVRYNDSAADVKKTVVKIGGAVKTEVTNSVTVKMDAVAVAKPKKIIVKKKAKGVIIVFPKPVYTDLRKGKAKGRVVNFVPAGYWRTDSTIPYELVKRGSAV